MRFSISSIALLSAIHQSLAAPAPAAIAEPSVQGVTETIKERQLLGNLLPGLVPGVLSLVGNLLKDVNAAVANGNPTEVLNILEQLQPTARPTSIAAAVAGQSDIWKKSPTRTDFFAAVATQIAGGLVLDQTLKAAFTGTLPVGENSVSNTNPPPPTPIYPKKADADAP